MDPEKGVSGEPERSDGSPDRIAAETEREKWDGNSRRSSISRRGQAGD